MWEIKDGMIDQYQEWAPGGSVLNVHFPALVQKVKILILASNKCFRVMVLSIKSVSTS